MINLEDLPGDACLHCGVELPAGTMAAFCSRRCRSGHRSAPDLAARAEARAALVCCWCGKTFAGARTDQKFCGRRCYKANETARISAARATARAGRTCPECGGAVNAHRFDKIYCRPACAKRALKRALSRQKRAARAMAGKMAGGLGQPR